MGRWLGCCGVSIGRRLRCGRGGCGFRRRGDIRRGILGGGGGAVGGGEGELGLEEGVGKGRGGGGELDQPEGLREHGGGGSAWGFVWADEGGGGDSADDR